MSIECQTNRMLDECNEYLSSLKAGQIKTQSDALKYFNVRYSLFTQNYPKECDLPACVLASNGFYFQNNPRCIKCFECEFQFTDLNCDNLSEILTLHILQKPNCNQAKISIKNQILSEEMSFDLDQTRPLEQHFSNENTNFFSEEKRLETFENCKLKIDVASLVKNGFYRVLKDPIKLSLKKDVETISGIEYVSKYIASLYHVRCAFCPYECLLFRNSHLNTVFKSPFDEHKEKFQLSCPMFSDSNKIDCHSAKGTNFFVRSDMLKEKMNWLRTLYEFDNEVADEPVSDFELASKMNELDEFNVKKLPKIFEHLINLKIAKSKKNFFETSNTVMYAPGSKNSENQKITADLNKIQEVLNRSNNVLSEKAFHPAYSQYETRRESFKDWPSTMSQQPDDLAKAGFYYFGIKDMVKCFFCNGGLKNWDYNDDPFQDHVRWFPKCQYIRQLMGPDYVESVREKFKNMDSGFETGKKIETNTLNSLVSGLPSSSSLVKKYQSGSKRSVSPRTLNSRLDSNIVRKIIDNCSIGKESIKKAIEIKLSVQDTNNNNIESTNLNYGDDFKSTLKMAAFSYEIENAKRRKIESLNGICDFFLCNVNSSIKTYHIRNLIELKYGCYPLDVRMLRTEDTEDQIYFLVNLKNEDKSKADDIITDIQNRLSKEMSEFKDVIVLMTNWTEIEEKIKPLLDKQIDMSTSIEQLKMQEQELQNFRSDSIEKSADKIEISEPKESKDLADKEAQRLMEENERLKNERLCVVCLTRDKNILYLPCAHLATCLDCSYSLQTCPMCRSAVQATVRTFT